MVAPGAFGQRFRGCPDLDFDAVEDRRESAAMAWWMTRRMVEMGSFDVDSITPSGGGTISAGEERSPVGRETEPGSFGNMAWEYGGAKGAPKGRATKGPGRATKGPGHLK